MLGDSTSILYEPYLKKALKDNFYYSRKTGKEPELAGFSEIQKPNAKDSRKTKDYLKLISAKFNTDILLINTGLHDIRYEINSSTPQVSIQDYEKNLKDIIKLGKKCSKIIIWITTTHINDTQHNNYPGITFKRFEEDNENYNQVALKIMKLNEIPIIDLRQFTLDIGGNVFTDHCHFTKQVRQKQAFYIAQQIENMSLWMLN